MRTVDMTDVTDYSDPRNWVYYGYGEDRRADVFLIAPTVDFADEFNMPVDDREQRNFFRISLEMEKGIYEDAGSLYAPYYRQCSMKAYSLDPAERERYLQIAHLDVRSAFEYYLDRAPSDRPLILAGFSQGSDMCYRLLRDYFRDPSLRERLISVYAIGWQLTREFVSENPWIVPAEAEDDIGTVITFDCESAGLKGSFLNPEGTWSYSINPLNWRTDSSIADSSLNISSRVYDMFGGLSAEIPNHCGCYIDPERGVLKVTDVDPADVEQWVPGLPREAFYVQDYQFFYPEFDTHA